MLELFQELKTKAAQGYFEELIRTYFLDNTHKAVVVVEPEKGLNEKTEKALAEKLAAYKDSLGKEETAQLIADTIHLKEYQQEPSSKEDLEKIPMLSRSDMKKEAAPLINAEKTVAGIPVIHHNIYSNGINYIHLFFDLSAVKEEWIPYLGILKAVLGDMDTQDYTYEDLANEINLHTGGFSINILASADQKDSSLIKKYEVGIKALYPKTGTAMRLLESMLCRTKLDDDKRLYEVLAQAKSRLEMQFMQAGHSVSALRAMSYFSQTGRFNDLCSGIGLYRAVAEAERDFEHQKENVKDILKQLFCVIFRPENLIVSRTGDEQGYAALEPELAVLKAALFTNSVEKEKMQLPCEKKNEGFKNAAQVQYVSRAGNFKNHGFAFTGALRVLRVILNYDYLWLNIRVKGGAYGCMSGFGRNGDVYFSTYRDPNLRRSDEVFNGIPEYLKNFDADERDMTKYVIGAISGMDTPLNPSAKGMRSMMAYLTHVTQEDYQKERDEVLTAGQAEIRALEPLIAAVLAQENICVIGNETVLEKEADLFFTLEDLF